MLEGRVSSRQRQDLDVRNRHGCQPADGGEGCGATTARRSCDKNMVARMQLESDRSEIAVTQTDGNRPAGSGNDRLWNQT